MQAHVGKKIFDKNAHSFLSLNIFSGLDCDMHLVLGDTKVNLSDLCCIFVDVCSVLREVDLYTRVFGWKRTN